MSRRVKETVGRKKVSDGELCLIITKDLWSEVRGKNLNQAIRLIRKKTHCPNGSIHACRYGS